MRCNVMPTYKVVEYENSIHKLLQTLLELNECLHGRKTKLKRQISLLGTVLLKR